MNDRDTTTQPALEEKERRELLSKQPTDPLRHIGGFFSAKKQDGDSKTLAGLASTSQRFNRLFQPAAQAAVDKILFNHIVHGEPDAVYAMLDKQPSLLLHTFTVTDPAGYILKDRTPLQAALCCQDPQMAKEIQRRLIDYAGPDEAARQWDAQFPASWKEDEKERWKLVFTQLKKLDKTIREAEEKDISVDQDLKLEVSEGSAVEKELKEFQRLLDTTRNKPIETGRTFNPLLLPELANRYDHYFHNSFSDTKRSLFWQRVYGYAQRFLSASDAQSFVAGLDKTQSNLAGKSPQNRNLEITLRNPASIQQARSSYYTDGVVGFNYGIYCRGGVTAQAGSGGVHGIRNFLSVKNSRFSEIYAAIPKFKPSAS